MIRVRLDDDEVIHIEVKRKDFDAQFRKAQRSGGPLEVHGPDGRVLGINPRRVLYWEESRKDASSLA